MNEGEFKTSPSSNEPHSECSKKTLLLFETVSVQLGNLEQKMDNIRTDIQKGALDYVKLEGEVIALRREVEDNIKPKVKELEGALDEKEKEEKADFKSLAGWIFGAIGILIALIALITSIFIRV